MAAQPWYYVGPKDIFPEEFPGFLMRSGPHLNYLRSGTAKYLTPIIGMILRPDY